MGVSVLIKMQALQTRWTGAHKGYGAQPATARMLSSRRHVNGFRVKAVQAPSHAELVKEAQKLVDLARSKATQEQLDAQADVVAKLSEAAGTNKVVQDLNDGSFRGYTLTGRTAQRFRTVITLGVLSFNKYQPTDQKIRMMDNDSHPGGVYKGPHGDVQQAYVVSAPFELVEADKVGEGSSEATPLGIHGQHVIMGEYLRAPDNPQRLAVVFKKMQMKPASEADLKPWLERLLPHNPTMDPNTGVLEVELPANNPEGWLDHLLTIEEFQLFPEAKPGPTRARTCQAGTLTQQSFQVV